MVGGRVVNVDRRTVARIAAPVAFLVAMTIAVLVVLFLGQRFGTEKVGKVFGPVMLLWFTTLAAIGVLNIGRSVDGASHAWVEAWLPTLGWIGIDPTNRTLAMDRHIRVAVGLGDEVRI